MKWFFRLIVSGDISNKTGTPRICIKIWSLQIQTEEVATLLEAGTINDIFSTEFDLAAIASVEWRRIFGARESL